ncbi:hypothetical protein [Rhizobium leguminosarum]|uniref:hypothetical protein n=1 Tax=Rhizobium leguminosarum TaxID=384 RepID=UPI003F9E3042
MLKSRQRTSAPVFRDLLQVRPHHLRSVQIDRDYADQGSALHYAVTPFVASTVSRIAQGFEPNSTQRAWRLTGDYGSGKSSLALALSRLAAAEPDLLPSQLHGSVSPIRLEPVLFVGEREPIGKGVLRALTATAARAFGSVPRKLAGLLSTEGAVEPLAVLDAIAAVSDALQSAGKARGLFIVLDELGKNLEFAVNSSDSDDVYLLQHLAELSVRSGPTPVVVVAILHQAVASYASNLPAVQRKEWEKVSSRFEEVVFAPPIEQTANLVAAALDIDLAAAPQSLAKNAERAMQETLELGWYGVAAGRDSLIRLAPSLLPLDPTTLPVLSRLLRRFGQNERSLFSFLSSAEPHGLMELCARPIDEFSPYRIADLYDYVVANLSGLLNSGTLATRWGIIVEVVSSLDVLDPAASSVIRTIAVLNLLDEPTLAATPAAVSLCVAGANPVERQKIERIIDELKKSSKTIYDRGASGALCLWPHTSVDLEDAFSKGLAAARTTGAGLDALRAHLSNEPIVARRHYVQTGALRHFDVRHEASERVMEVVSKAATSDPSSDGQVIVFVSTTEAERREAVRWLEEVAGTLPATVIACVPRPVAAIVPFLNEVAAWKWVRESVPSLAGDRIARNEAARQLSLAEARLGRSLDAYLDIRGPAASSMSWYHAGRELEITTGRSLTGLISDICDKNFDLSPKVTNELLNRRALSSAAASARFRVIEGISAAAGTPSLGLDNGGTPPELAVYLSVIKAGNVHVERQGGWVVQTPPEGSDPLRLRPSLLKIGEVLESAGDRPVPYEEVADAIRGGRYGVREGLVPLLIAIYLAVNWHRTAVYEDGTYLEQVGDREFSRIVKEPEHFQLQHCVVEGVRAEIFNRLAAALGMAGPRDGIDLLDVVRPLVTFVARLPDHSRRTRQLSAATLAARNALLAGRDPTALIFRDLPNAFGIEPFATGEAVSEKDISAFIKAVSRSVGELREAYPGLLRRVATGLGAALDADETLGSQRVELLRRSERLKSALAEPELKSFVMRLADAGLDDQAWLESIASLVARKPPERWVDNDEVEFNHRLHLLSRRFRHVEAARFSDQTESTNSYRLVVTAADGHEVEQVYRLSKDETDKIAAIEEELRGFLQTNGKLGRVAAARALLALDGSGSKD